MNPSEILLVSAVLVGAGAAAWLLGPSQRPPQSSRGPRCRARVLVAGLVVVAFGGIVGVRIAVGAGPTAAFWISAACLGFGLGCLARAALDWRQHARAHSEPRARPLQPHTSFAVQAVLIVLPVLVLTLVGLLSLRHDRLLADQEARERAGRLAQEMADRAFEPLFELDPIQPTNQTSVAAGIDLDRPVFELSRDSSLVWPRPVASPPLPHPLDPWALTETARDAWTSAQRASAEADGSSASGSWEAFLALDPPVEFAAHAQFELAQIAARAGRPDDALRRFEELAANDLENRLESGLPLAPIAAWKAFELRLAASTNDSGRVAHLRDACSNLVFRPTALTPDLLSRVEALSSSLGAEALPPPPREHVAGCLREWRGSDSLALWRRLWETTELARGLFAAAQEEWQRRGLLTSNVAGVSEPASSGESAPIWVDLPNAQTAPAPSPGDAGTSWLITRSPQAPRRFLGWTECEVTNLIERVRGQLPAVPPYFEITLTIAGRPLPAPRSLPRLAERPARSLASSEFARPTLLASVYITDPAALYAQQRQRTWWFAAVVLAAAGTAGVGLLTARRAFERQLRLNDLKSNFVSSVSHELRAPIASVRLLAESLDRGRITDEARRRDYFRLIAQECRRLTALVENVLDFSRIDQGRKRYEFEPTDLIALVTQTVKLMEPYAAERQVSLRSQLPPALEPPPALDGKAIQQALVNLIDNAVKHAPPGTAVTVALSGPAAAHPGCHPGPEAPTIPSRATPHEPRPLDHASGITLSVTDEGPGIPAAEHARIFEPFYRRGSELRRETTGVGIGLTIVKHVVDAHGGVVRVESELGKGSRLVIELPLCRVS